MDIFLRYQICGRRIMAVLQLPKLVAWVRFPSPAPTFKPCLRQGLKVGLRRTAMRRSSLPLMIEHPRQAKPVCGKSSKLSLLNIHAAPAAEDGAWVRNIYYYHLYQDEQHTVSLRKTRNHGLLACFEIIDTQ